MSGAGLARPVMLAGNYDSYPTATYVHAATGRSPYTAMCR